MMQPSISVAETIPQMPQITVGSYFDPMAQSPPSYDPGTSSSIISGLETTSASNQPGSIDLISRGISLLSIGQLREFLREYSLPTGGNKHALVDRLVIFLETFGPSQQNLYLQFSLKLKKYLSVETNIDSDSHPSSESEEPTQQVPHDLIERIYTTSPSCLFQTIQNAKNEIYLTPPLGPVIVHPSNPVVQLDFTLPASPINTVPILQFSPVDNPNLFIKKLTFQLCGTIITLRDNILWCDLTEYQNQDGIIEIKAMDPSTPVVVLIRWMEKVTIQQLTQRIIEDRGPAPEIQVDPANPPSHICPLTRKLILRPARGVKCNHPQCFDLTGFLCYSIKKHIWQCPICHIDLQAEDLRIDPYFFKVAKATSRIQKKLVDE